MKNYLLLLLAMLTFVVAKAQSDDAVTLDFYGFVRVDAYMDTYKGVDAGHDMFYLLPVYKNVGGVEVNKQISSHITPIASRLGVRATFPEILNAKVNGILETDFAGNLKSDPTMFRILHAYSQFVWEKSSLVLGQTWHPFFAGSCAPNVTGINTGAPFSPFNRSPLIRYNKKYGSLTLSGTALSEIQYASPLMDFTDNATEAEDNLVTPNHAKRNGAIPELVLSTEWNKNAITIGAGVSYKTIKPRFMFKGTDAALNALSDEYFGSTSFMAYGRYKNKMLTVLVKGYMGENMSHLTLPGGYGIATYDAESGKETYTSYNTMTVSLNAVYGQKWQFSIFAGYGKNLGTTAALYDFGGKAVTKGTFTNMQTMFRVSPSVALNLAKFKLQAEYEMTSANYGKGAIDFSNGLYNETISATNNRVIIVATHFF
jgi:hypothetical protein